MFLYTYNQKKYNHSYFLHAFVQKVCEKLHGHNVNSRYCSSTNMTSNNTVCVFRIELSLGSKVWLNRQSSHFLNFVNSLFKERFKKKCLKLDGVFIALFFLPFLNEQMPFLWNKGKAFGLKKQKFSQFLNKLLILEDFRGILQQKRESHMIRIWHF